MSSVPLTWLPCDLATGAVAEELLSLTTSGPLERVLGAPSSAQADLALAGAPPQWEPATMPGRTMLVAVDRDTDLPLWAGVILTRTRGSADTVALGLATPEAYLDRRYTGTYTATATDRATIMAGVAAPALTGGLPITIDAPALGVTGTYSVQDTDDRSVLSVLQELQQMDSWPEWTVDVQWADAAHTAVQLVLRVRQQIGTVRPDPEATFDLPGCITTYEVAESYEAGKGATVVQARGEGEGSARLTSDVYTADDLIAAGWPRWVHRYTPGTNITSAAALNAAAAMALAQQRLGATAWTVTAAAAAAPRLGRDWAMGDSIRVQIESSPAHPDGAEIVARAYGWRLDTAADTVTPVLLQDEDGS